MPALDVKVVPGRREPLRLGPRFQHEPRPTATPAAITSATGKILDKARLLAGAALDAPADSLGWERRRVRCGGDPRARQTIADIALYAHGSGALPPGVEGGLDAQTVYRD